jgi:hypothetical protein
MVVWCGFGGGDESSWFVGVAWEPRPNVWEPHPHQFDVNSSYAERDL